MNWIMDRLKKEIKKAKTNDPFEIAESKNILIRYLPLGNTLGFYMKNVRHQVITLNSDMDEHLFKFVCAHELGHAVLHPDESTPFLHKNTFFSKEKIEREANTFAVELLLPDHFISEYCDTNLSIYETCEMYGIPRELAHLKKF